ncbi:hypothetical protein [Nonomuraea cavernae]|uniref:Uncharacterized protein n=1 Tax=Nonomuraea cavernae TaxID=2045107 RepID=A0A918DS73_9ACTN|nr:hypothetical protein [Nonomuraea cavernae]MCA2190612.1 hypothetical protein [Nonomuraea cavernae]GGO81356.1 hypothetical protein GCM10012289_70140 [Nonomuraea cavernae]
MTTLHVLDQLGMSSTPRLSRIDLAPGGLPARHLTDGWWHASAEGAPHPLRKATARAARRHQHLLGYLWNTDVSVTDMVCERDLRPGHETVTAYSGLRLQDATHHVFIGGAPPADVAVDDLHEVTLISGGCHFSTRAAQLITESGRRVPITSLRHGQVGERVVGLRLDDELTISETETAARLPTVGAGVLSRIPPGVPVRVVLDVPHTATTLILLRAAQRGEVSPRLLLQWCDAVAARHPRLARLHAENWRAALSSTPLIRPMQVEVSAELETVGAYLRHALSCGRVPATEELVDLVATQDRLWRLLSQVAPPTTPVELAELSYVAAQMRAAVSTRHASRLAIAVENVYETKIQQRSGALARILRAELPDVRFHLVGLYPLGRLWVRDADGGIRLNLHTHDPGRWAVDEHGRRIDLIQLATDLYAEAARPLAGHG